jgi:hypothetical protein|uniref:hypothetical protein n=1 Tax=Candidatus Electrothrix sp. TaxID=2170559 RepID=UPI004057213A
MILEDCLYILKYYSEVEKESHRILKTIPYKENNISAEIPSIAPIIVESGSLIDTIYQSKKDKRKIFNYYCEEFSIIDSVAVFIDHPLRLINPFKNCFQNNIFCEPTWWNAYNGLKHSRLDNIDKSNIENLINIVCALFLVISQDEDFFESLLINDYVRTRFAIDHIKKYKSDIYKREKCSKNKQVCFETEMFFTEIGLNTSILHDPYKYRNPAVTTKYLYRYWPTDHDD